MILSKLSPMGKHWYAAYIDGNATFQRPTIFPTSMPRAEVIKEIITQTPGIVVRDTAHGTK